MPWCLRRWLECWCVREHFSYWSDSFGTPFPEHHPHVFYEPMGTNVLQYYTFIFACGLCRHWRVLSVNPTIVKRLGLGEYTHDYINNKLHCKPTAGSYYKIKVILTDILKITSKAGCRVWWNTIKSSICFVESYLWPLTYSGCFMNLNLQLALSPVLRWSCDMVRILAVWRTLPTWTKTHIPHDYYI